MPFASRRLNPDANEPGAAWPVMGGATGQDHSFAAAFVSRAFSLASRFVLAAFSLAVFLAAPGPSLKNERTVRPPVLAPSRTAWPAVLAECLTTSLPFPASAATGTRSTLAAR